MRLYCFQVDVSAGRFGFFSFWPLIEIQTDLTQREWKLRGMIDGFVQPFARPEVMTHPDGRSWITHGFFRTHGKFPVIVLDENEVGFADEVMMFIDISNAPSDIGISNDKHPSQRPLSSWSNQSRPHSVEEVRKIRPGERILISVGNLQFSIENHGGDVTAYDANDVIIPLVNPPEIPKPEESHQLPPLPAEIYVPSEKVAWWRRAVQVAIRFFRQD